MRPGITIFIYSQFFPVNELNSIGCVNAKCKRRLFDVKGDVMWISNSGLSPDRVPAGIGYFETVCHSCKTKYKVMLQ